MCPSSLTDQQNLPIPKFDSLALLRNHQEWPTFISPSGSTQRSWEKGHDQQWKKVLIVKQTLLISTMGRIVGRICTLISKFTLWWTLVDNIISKHHILLTKTCQSYKRKRIMFQINKARNVESHSLWLT